VFYVEQGPKAFHQALTGFLDGESPDHLFTNTLLSELVLYFFEEMKLLNGAGQGLGDHQPMEEILHLQRLFLIHLLHNRSMSRKHQGSSRDEVSSRTTFEKEIFEHGQSPQLQSQSANDYDEESIPADEVDAESAPDSALDLNPDHEYDRVDEENQMVDFFESFIVVLTTERIFTPAEDTCLYCQEDTTLTFPFI
jgi:hypothetical protein